MLGVLQVHSRTAAGAADSAEYAECLVTAVSRAALCICVVLSDMKNELFLMLSVLAVR